MELNRPLLHFLFETAGYLIGGQLFWHLRRRQGDAIDSPSRWLIIGSGIFGAALGSRLLAGLEDPAHFTLAGKTVVGGLLGGWIAIELAKRLTGIQSRTGDLFAIPLALGIGIGRIGCFLGGLEDQTHGLPTSLPWAVDFGDGILRHPAQLYEMAFCFALVFVLARFEPPLPGDRFRLFISAYLAWRVAIDFIKPGVPLFLGLTAIQWASLLGVLYCAKDIWRWIRSYGAHPALPVL
jgi:prolipoprotein diacylglyceryltransferase